MKRGGGCRYEGVSAYPEGPPSAEHETSMLQILESPAVHE